MQKEKQSGDGPCMTGELGLCDDGHVRFLSSLFQEVLEPRTDVNVSTAQLGFGNSLAGLLVAVMAPILGAIADRGSAKKKFMIFFAYLGALMSACLFWVQQGIGLWPSWSMFWAWWGSQGPSRSMMRCFPTSPLRRRSIMFQALVMPWAIWAEDSCSLSTC